MRVCRGDDDVTMPKARNRGLTIFARHNMSYPSHAACRCPTTPNFKFYMHAAVGLLRMHLQPAVGGCVAIPVHGSRLSRKHNSGRLLAQALPRRPPRVNLRVYLDLEKALHLFSPHDALVSLFLQLMLWLAFELFASAVRQTRVVTSTPSFSPRDTREKLTPAKTAKTTTSPSLLA